MSEIWDGPGDNWYPGEDETIYAECEHNPPCLLADGTDSPCGASMENETAEILADPDTMTAIREGLSDLPAPSFTIRDDALYEALSDDDGITTDGYDHWPYGREFPS
jgi:hypothetical protein